jgi:hypothetical protein
MGSNLAAKRESQHGRACARAVLCCAGSQMLCYTGEQGTPPTRCIYSTWVLCWTGQSEVHGLRCVEPATR